jgi:hypothetical protein
VLDELCGHIPALDVADPHNAIMGLGAVQLTGNALGFMTSDLDIYRTANVLIREHGDEADLVAAQRADSFLEAGDLDGCAVWKRVLKAIKEIRRVEPREGEAVN